jgi:hypothetical protein
MKKLNILLALIFVLVFAPAALADTQDLIDYQVDSGQFNCWMHSDGKTWQNVPGFGVVKPNDTVTFTYTVEYDGPNKDKIAGVKSVYFYDGDESLYNKTARVSWQTYKKYSRGDYANFAVKALTVDKFNYLGNNKVEITITTTLDSVAIDKYYPDYPGQYMHEQFQGKLTQGRKFYTPTVIEWQLKDAPPDFWPSVPSLSYTGEVGSSITIPAMVYNSGTKDTTDFLAFWEGESWADAEAAGRKHTNLTIDKGQKADTPISVTVPATAKVLWLRANVDNQTPASEVNLKNNLISITVGPNTADVGVTASVNPTRPMAMCNAVATFVVKNYGPAVADVTLRHGENSGKDWTLTKEKTEKFTLQPGESKTITRNTAGRPAGYKAYFAAIATVTNTTDPNLANNQARTQLIEWVPLPQAQSFGPGENHASLIH